MIHNLKDTDLRIVDAPLPFEEKYKARIDVFWEQAFEANPRLWNGPFFMFSDVRVANGVLTGNAHRTDFATFLYWRETGREALTVHITGTSFPVLKDGSLLAVRHSKHTANPGRVYFPAGSFDQSDNFNGRLDPIANFKREFLEEVGVELLAKWGTGNLIACETANSFHVTRKFALDYTFAAIEKKWQTHRKNGGDDEIDGLVQIISAAQIPDQMPEYARELCEYHFSDTENRSMK